LLVLGTVSWDYPFINLYIFCRLQVYYICK